MLKRNVYLCYCKLVFCFFCVFSQQGLLLAEVASCKNNSKEKLIASEEGTADLIANFWKKAGSLAVLSASALKSGFEQLQLTVKPKDLCQGSCKQVKDLVYIKTIPSKLLDDYSDKELCEEMFAKTKSKPLSFKFKASSLDLLHRWISEFSQGKNAAGKQLYSLCPGSCSPQYSYYLESLSSGYSLSAAVFCGPARDKWDNNYIIEHGLRWICIET